MERNKARTHPATVFWLTNFSPPAEIPSPTHLRLHTLTSEQEVLTKTPIVPKHHTISLAIIPLDVVENQDPHHTRSQTNGVYNPISVVISGAPLTSPEPPSLILCARINQRYYFFLQTETHCPSLPPPLFISSLPPRLYAHVLLTYRVRGALPFL